MQNIDGQKQPDTIYLTNYLAFNVLFIGATGAFFGAIFADDSLPIGDAFSHFSYGILIAFLLIPIHEYIHVLAYRSQGAENTSYDANLRKFYFMALADKFVANRKEFKIVALAPFVVITSILLVLMLIVSPLWQFTILGILFTHTACCSGDFGMMSYFSARKTEDVVTYDDVANQLTHFYSKD